VQAVETLAVLAEVSVAFAGFSGIVTVFRRPDPSLWSGLDRFRLRFMVEFSLATLALSLLPLLLAELGLTERGVWGLSSLVLGLGASYYLVRSLRRVRSLVVAGEPVSRPLAIVSGIVGVAVAASALANATGAFARPSGVYLAGVGGCLFVSSAMFARLLLANPGAHRARD
jgi:hypothetical protein